MRKSTLRGFIALCIAGVLAAGVCCMGFASRGDDGKWFSNFKNISGWHWSDKSPVDDTGDNQDTDGVIVSNGEFNGISLASKRLAVEEFGDYGISVQAETAQVLTATFTPANTTFQDVTWAVSGGNGKVTVTPVAGKPLQATVAVTGSFNQQAVVTCTSKMESNLKATATVDYLKVPTYNHMPDYLAFDSIKANMTISPINFFDNTTGTISATRASGTLTISNDVAGICKQVYSGEVKSSVTFNNVDLINNSVNFTFDMFLPNASASEKAAIYAQIAYWADEDGADICTACYSNIHYFYGDTSYSYYYEDGDTAGEFYLDVTRWSDVIVRGGAINLDKNGLVFVPPQA